MRFLVMMSNKLKMATFLGVWVLRGFLFPETASAQSLGRILACSDLPRADERLQCYDAAARAAIGLTSVNDGLARSSSGVALQERASELDARESALKAREAAVSESETALRKRREISGVVPEQVSVPALSTSSSKQAMHERELALSLREAALNEREAKLGQPSANANASLEEEASLFGIPIPFTRKDSLNQAAQLPSQKVFRNDDGIVESIEVAVVEWSVSGEGYATFVLANGQVWRQLEGAPPRLSSDPGKKNFVKISRGAMGSFNITINNTNRIIKARRIDGRKKIT
jgi:hypothetical protein